VEVGAGCSSKRYSIRGCGNRWALDAPRVAVNVSEAQLRQPNFVVTVL